MKQQKNPFHPKALLWWIGITALAISAALFFFLEDQAEYNVKLEQQRIFVTLIGVVIAGICVIAGSAGRWFYPK